MLATLKRLCGVPELKLPPDVTAILESAAIVERPGDEKTGPRMIVFLGGPLRGSFVFDREEAASRIRNRWPWLNDGQLKRAVDFLEARTRLAISPLSKPRRRNWVTDY